MKVKKLSVTGTGDSLFVAKFPSEYDPELRRIAEFVQGCDIRMTNLETNLSDFEYYGNAISGGTWLNTRREYFKDLLRFGFNYFGTANNHAMDYCHNGLLSTLDTLDRFGAVHSGSGRSLEEAEKPAVLEVQGMKIAIFAVDASCAETSKAGRGTKVFPPRPGVNYLRHDTVYKLTAQEMEELKKIAANTRLNFNRQKLIDTGYLTPDKENRFHFGTLIFTTETDVPETSCNAADKKRILDGIRKARQSCDYVFVMIHCHNNDNIREENPAGYLKEFNRACIDEGVSAVFGGGCHRLRGMEIYKNCPIFYSLGDFIYQGLQVEHLPADFMEKYGVDIFATAEEALYARSRGGKVGLHCNKLNYQTVLPRVEFEDGKMTSLSLLPVYLNFDKKGAMNGLPTVAEGKEGEEIRDILNELSGPFGVKLKFSGSMLVPA